MTSGLTVAGQLASRRVHLISRISHPVVVVELLRARLRRLFGVFPNASAKFTQPSLKPSLLGPHPILPDQSISVIYAAVNFALSKNKLP